MLKDESKKSEFMILLDDANQKKSNFILIQDKMLAFKANIEKNKKLLSALESETEELEEASNDIVIGNLGEIDFSKFDKNSDTIFANKRKIEKLRTTIQRLEYELEYLLITEFIDNKKLTVSSVSKAFSYLGDCLIDEFLQSLDIDGINKAFTAFTAVNNPAIDKKYFLTVLFERLYDKIKLDSSNLDFISYPNVEFKTNLGVVERGKRIEFLSKELDK